MRISLVRHPSFAFNDYELWRYTYRGGRDFVNRYLVQFSQREDTDAFADRKAMSYCAAFAKVAINKLKNAFTGRMSEIKRIGGSDSYQTCCQGKEGGVDLYGSSMNTFLAQQVLPELMTMGKVGIYVDRPPINDPLLANNRGNKPYLYTYAAEDICSWNIGYSEGEYIFYSVLLHDQVVTTENGLPSGTVERYRQMWLAPDGVHVQMWSPNHDAHGNDVEDFKVGQEIVLPLKRIPFIVPGLIESLLVDVADYQIGLTNIASSDLMFVLRANFPFYVEQFDPSAEATFQRMAQPVGGTGTALEGKTGSASKDIPVGVHQGRRVPKGVLMPEFIAPQTEPLIASMKKQEQMKAEIFELIDIAASNSVGMHASAESKAMDNQGLEGGMTNIGNELQWADQEIAKVWAMYEAAEPATVIYPTKYSLKTDEQRQKEAENLDGLKTSVSSITYAKCIQKRLAHTLLDESETPETLQKIENEIDSAEYTASTPEDIAKDLEGGLVSAVTASKARGYNGEKEVPIAQREHAERLAVIAESQAAASAARGVPDGSPVQGDPAKDEKTLSQSKAIKPATKTTRGPNK